MLHSRSTLAFLAIADCSLRNELSVRIKDRFGIYESDQREKEESKEKEQLEEQEKSESG